MVIAIEILEARNFMSQGLQHYSHVLQALSNFTCFNIKTSSLDPSLNICYDELTNIYPPLSFQIWYFLNS